MYGYVYLITNLTNSKQYIGSHKGEIEDSYMGSGSYIKQAIKEFGKENFKKEILAIANSSEELSDLEIRFIDEYNAINDDKFYNCRRAGRNINTLKEIYSCPIKEKIVDTNNPNYANYWSDEQKHNLSIKQKNSHRYKGNKNPNYGKKEEFATNGKKVYAYDLEGNLIKEFNTKRMALNFLNSKSHSMLNKAIANGFVYKGYIWKMNFNKV